MASKPPPTDVLGLDEDEDNELDDWNSAPRNARLFVYASLEKLIAEMDQAFVFQQLANASSSPEQQARADAMMALIFAKELLRSADEEICPDCGGYHDEAAPHPKDLS